MVSRLDLADIEDVMLGSEELRYVVQAAGKVFGPVDIEDILDVIYSQFYIGM